MNLKEKRAAAYKAAQALIETAKSDNRELTDEESTKLQELVDEVKSLDAQIERAEQDEQLFKSLADLGGIGDDERPVRKESQAAKSLGDHFVKHAGERLAEIKGTPGASVGAPEFKANTDPHTIGAVFGPVLTDVDRTVVQAVRPRLVVADLLGSGTISGNAIQYFVEGALEGAFTTVAEGGAKPQLHVADPTAVVDALKKIAGWVKFSDEMLEDLDFIVSEINGRLLYELARFEEQQILDGTGSGSNLQGILRRTGIQTETAADNTDNADALFRAITKVSTGSGLDADGLVINPADYQSLRLSKDGNGQYMGGGFFEGQYGNGAVVMNPPVWGLRTVVTPAIAAGTALVGAYGQAATLYRKGGVRVESTNSHDSDFTSNLVTVRAEERVALAVRRPAGFVKVTLSNTPPEE